MQVDRGCSPTPSGRLLEPGGDVRSRWMAIHVATHDKTRGIRGLIFFSCIRCISVLLS